MADVHILVADNELKHQELVRQNRYSPDLTALRLLPIPPSIFKGCDQTTRPHIRVIIQGTNHLPKYALVAKGIAQGKSRDRVGSGPSPHAWRIGTPNRVLLLDS